MYAPLNKKIFLSIVCSLAMLYAAAQTEYIVKVNVTTGLPVKVDSIPGVRWLQSYAAFNEATKEYTVMGSWQPGQSPTYLYTFHAETGNILYNPVLPHYNKMVSMQYSKTTGVLYGIIYDAGVYYLVEISKTTGGYTIIHDITGIQGIGQFVIDEANQRLYVNAVDNNPNFALRTIDLHNGNVIYHVSTKPISELCFDNTTGKLYAVTNRPDPAQQGNVIISLCSVDPVTGAVTIIKDLPGITNIFSGSSTFNENDHLYLFTAMAQVQPAFLHSVDVTSGSIVTKAPIPTSGVLDNDNLIFFRYDNITDALYGMLWEAKTILPPVVVGDSGCVIDTRTKIYTKPLANMLVVNKAATKCNVVMNVYNSIGQLIIKSRQINNGLNEIGLPYLSNGIYYYSFLSGQRVLSSGRFLKQ